jgi:hypothetical protein
MEVETLWASRRFPFRLIFIGAQESLAIRAIVDCVRTTAHTIRHTNARPAQKAAEQQSNHVRFSGRLSLDSR